MSSGVHTRAGVRVDQCFLSYPIVILRPTGRRILRQLCASQPTAGLPLQPTLAAPSAREILRALGLRMTIHRVAWVPFRLVPPTGLDKVSLAGI